LAGHGKLTQIVPVLAGLTLILSMIAYLVLSLFKLKVNKYVSIAHLFTILLLNVFAIVVIYGVGFYIAASLFFISIALLISNMTIAIRGSKKEN
jgi:hypothetical protein